MYTYVIEAAISTLTYTVSNVLKLQGHTQYRNYPAHKSSKAYTGSLIATVSLWACSITPKTPIMGVS